MKRAQVTNSQTLVKARGSQSLCSGLFGGTEEQGWKSIVAGVILKSFRSLWVQRGLEQQLRTEAGQAGGRSEDACSRPASSHPNPGETNRDRK